MKYYIKKKINLLDKNPFSKDGTYSGFSCFSTEGLFDYGLLTKRTKTGCWLVQFKKQNDEYEKALRDFLEYEIKNGRKVIIETQEDETAIAEILNNSCKSKIPDILVHSTNLSVVDTINESGRLLAPFFLYYELRWNYQRKGSEIDKYLENEPSEYKEYVMLDEIHGYSELVMAMSQYQTFNVNMDSLYQPGARYYIDARKLENDGLIVQDGVHTAKVHKEIDLGKYLLRLITISDLQDRESWTPRTFTDEANRVLMGNA